MSLTLSELRDELRDHLGLDSSDLDNTAANRLLNRSYWQLLDAFPFREKETSADFALTTGTREYSVPATFEALRKFSIKDPVSEKRFTLHRMTDDFYENNYSTRIDERGIPTHYYREGNKLFVWPTPDQDLEGFIKYWAPLTDLSLDVDVPGFPKNWHEILLFGAVYRGYYKIGDIVRAERLMASHSKMINEAIPVESKEERDSTLAGIEVLQNEYDAR